MSPSRGLFSASEPELILSRCLTACDELRESPFDCLLQQFARPTRRIDRPAPEADRWPVMGNPIIRFAALAAALLACAPSAIAANDVDNGSFAVIEANNATVPPPSEEALIFTGQDEKPLTPSRDGFRGGVDSVVSGAKAFSTWMGPETWIFLILGFGVVGFVVRRSERVLRFEPRRDVTDQTNHPEHRSAGSGPDASTPPHSGSDPAPSARRDQAE